MKPDLRVFPDVNELSLRAAEAVARTINDAVRSTGRCSLVLSGGSTPRTLYGLLASRFRDQIPWAHVHVFWGDERYVPPGDAHSNYRMAKDTLLDHVPCPTANVHPMPTHLSAPGAAARDYEATLRSYFSGAPPVFDLVLLGLGPEGHTASLFPGSPALAEPTRWVLAVTAPADPPSRLTLTFPALNQAANAYFLVAGSNKARALHHVLTGTADPNMFPAAGVRLAAGRLIWWVDREAAAQHVDPDLHKGAIEADRPAVRTSTTAKSRTLTRPAGRPVRHATKCARSSKSSDMAKHANTGRNHTWHAHGEPTGVEEMLLTKRALGWPEDRTFDVPDEALRTFRESVDRGVELEAAWRRRVDACAVAHPEMADPRARALAGDLPGGQSYRDEVPPPSVRARVSIEAASPFGWERYVGLESGATIGVNRFGASAPGPVVMREFGFTPAHVVETAKAVLKQTASS